MNDRLLLPSAERSHLLEEWNDTAAEYGADARVHELFESQAERTPNRTAVRVGSEELSYAELNERASRMAVALRSRDVGRGQRVGLCIERGSEMLAAVLGILKAGAAYVPLDPVFPQERLRFMAEDAELSLLVSTSALAGAFDLPRDRQLLLDSDLDLAGAAVPIVGLVLLDDLGLAGHFDAHACLLFACSRLLGGRRETVFHRPIPWIWMGMAGRAVG